MARVCHERGLAWAAPRMHFCRGHIYWVVRLIIPPTPSTTFIILGLVRRVTWCYVDAAHQSTAQLGGYDPRSPLGRQCIHTRATQPLDWCAASTQIRIFILYIVYKRILFSNLSFLLLFHSDIVRLTGLYFVSCKIYYRLHYIICNAVTHIAYKLFLAYREGNIYSTYFVLYFCNVWTLSVYGPKVVGGRGTRAAASSLDLKQEHLSPASLAQAQSRFPDIQNSCPFVPF